MPQVQVALRSLAQGKSVRVNDVISYIMTTSASSGIPSSDNAAKRAFAPQDVMAATSTLKADVEWYLYKQIFPPIERLCAPIPGTDATQLAECLGLDTKKYSIAPSSTSNQTTEISPLESQIPDELRFKDSARLTLRCRSCKHAFIFEGLASPSSRSTITPNGIICPSPTCQKPFATLTLVVQLEHAIRVQTSKYYDGYLICDDSSCGNRTRQMSVYGHRCLGPRGRAEGCRGRMRYEYGEKALYNQLLYFRGLWDVDKGTGGGGVKGEGGVKKGAVGGVKGEEAEEDERVRAAREWNRERFGTVRGVVEGYLKKCGRVWVQMDALFGFALEL